MRVIAGNFKGCVLKGSRKIKIRPSTDRLKEALFNILGSKNKGSCFGDFFCGYGSVGIEALSRGASNAIFVDKNPKCTSIVEENLSKVKKLFDCSDTYLYSINNMETGLFIEKSYKKNLKFDIIFMDPPYQTNLIENCLSKFSDYDILSDSGWIIAETLQHKDIGYNTGMFQLFMQRSYGKSKLLFFKKKDK